MQLRDCDEGLASSFLVFQKKSRPFFSVKHNHVFPTPPFPLSVHSVPLPTAIPRHDLIAIKGVLPNVRKRVGIPQHALIRLKPRRFLSAVASLILIYFSEIHAESLGGTVIGALDGDTIEVLAQEQ